ncbi:hypothetical protein D9M72_345280 [compost metagenome]
MRTDHTTDHNRPMKCQICGRLLERKDGPLSVDCGGDCWGCVGEVEATTGWEPSLKKVRDEFALGLRPEWSDPSIGN